MSLDQKQLAHVAHLARLQLAPEKLESVQNKLHDILAFVEQMSQVDTDNVSPMAHPLGEMQRTRDDIVSEADNHELFQQGAPATEADLYLVPQVIE